MLKKIQVSRTIRALNALTDRQLADIGIERANIKAHVRSLFE